ncbi:MAG: cupin domain-containing protein [Planctomycetota bacterium]|nr:cupin domain-containing protein [Planctomycetota bacterium]
MEAHDVAALAASLPTLDLSRMPTKEEAMAAAPLLGSLGSSEVRLCRFAGQPPWEKHPEDELIHVLDGAVRVTLLEGAEPSTIDLRAGSLVVVPAGVWHRSLAPDGVTVIAVTPAEGNEASFADDPRS